MNFFFVNISVFFLNFTPYFLVLILSTITVDVYKEIIKHLKVAVHKKKLYKAPKVQEEINAVYSFCHAPLEYYLFLKLKKNTCEHFDFL